jgi:N-acylneuraminate cytidylyltransferase
MDRMVAVPQILALIPARGGSKSIPRKNILPLAGHPLLAWSVAAARDALRVHRTIVSTDDERIAETARNYGAETPFLRPLELAKDDTMDLPVFVHALDWLRENEGYHPDLVVQLRPTSPLRPHGMVDRAIELLQADNQADSVRCVTTPSQNPFKMWRINQGSLAPLLENGCPEPYNMPRQALPSVFWQTGHIDVIRTRTIREKKSLTGDRILPLTIEGRYAVDIDDMIHWRLAEAILSESRRDMVSPDAESCLAGIRLFVLDFDGVFTDNRVQVGQDGREYVTCSRGDGLGIERLRRKGIEAVVLSTETNPVVGARCRKLNLPFVQGMSDKGLALRALTESRGVGLEEIAFVGNDVNDLECLRLARAAVVPADAHPEALREADLVLSSRGGHGAVREVCELAIAASSRGKEHSRCEQ